MFWSVLSCTVISMTVHCAAVTDVGAQQACNALPHGQVLTFTLASTHTTQPTHTQSNSSLQSIDVSSNPHMDKSWQKLLNHVTKGKTRG